MRKTNPVLLFQGHRECCMMFSLLLQSCARQLKETIFIYHLAKDCPSSGSVILPRKMIFRMKIGPDSEECRGKLSVKLAYTGKSSSDLDEKFLSENRRENLDIYRMEDSMFGAFLTP